MCISGLLLAGCSGDEEEKGNQPEPGIKPGIEFHDEHVLNGINFTAEGNTACIRFTASTNWKAKIAKTRNGVEWCYISTTSGYAGYGEIYIEVAPNDTPEERSVVLTLEAGNIKKTLKITQKEGNAIILSTDRLELNNKEQVIEIKVKANVEYYTYIEYYDNPKEDWIKKLDANTRAMEEKTVKFSIAANASPNMREGYILFESVEGILEVLHIYQEGSDVLFLYTKKDYPVGDKEEIITIGVSSNIDYGVKMPNVDWISEVTDTRAMSSHKLLYKISANEEYENRSAEIIFYDKSNPTLADTARITQSQKNAIILTEKEYTASIEGGEFEITLNANVEFDIKMPNANWIQKAPETRGLTSHKHRYIISKNEKYDDRKAEIIYYKSDNQKIADTLRVTQLCESVISLHRGTYTVKAEGEQIKIGVNSNIEYEVKMPEVDWITQTPDTRGLTTSYLNYTIAKNETYDERKAEIIFFQKDNQALADTLKITQKPQEEIVLSKREFELDVEGGTVEVELTTNVDYRTSYIPYWITVSPSTRGLTQNKLRYTIAKNDTYDERKAEIVFYKYGDSKIADTLSITQAKTEGIILSTKTYSVKREGASIEVRLRTNIEYEVKMPEVDWISKTPNTRGLTTSYLNYTITRNDTYSERSANIIYYKKGDVSFADTLKITQDYEKTAFFSIKKHEAKPEGDTLKVDLSSSTSYTLSMPTWIKKAVDTRGLNKEAITFTIESSTPDSERAGRIIAEFRSNNGYARDTITVTQKKYISKKSYHVATAGTLSDLINPAEKFLISDLKLTGKLNGTDIKYIRDMGLYSTKFRTLDLSEARIVSGGEKYYYNSSYGVYYYNTQNDIIGTYMFASFKSIKSILLPANITSIDSYAFSYCTDLPSIQIPNSVKTIGERAFEYSGLTSITLPTQLENIEKAAFRSCNKLSTITFSQGSASVNIGNNAFEYCTSLKTVTLSNNVTSIGSSAFYKCEQLSSINIPDEVTTIGGEAFFGTALKTITLGKKLSSIDGSPFGSCKQLTEILVSPQNKKYASVDGVLYKAQKDTLIAYPDGKGTEYTIPNNIRVISDYAFYYRNSLVSVTIPESVVAIGNSSFYSCGSLKEVHAKRSTPAVLGGSTFYRKTRYATLYVPKGKYTEYWNNGWGDKYFVKILEE